jgi:hypothetical protein
MARVAILWPGRHQAGHRDALGFDHRAAEQLRRAMTTLSLAWMRIAGLLIAVSRR